MIIMNIIIKSLGHNYYTFLKIKYIIEEEIVEKRWKIQINIKEMNKK